MTMAEPVEAMHSGIKSEEKASVRPVLQSFSFQEARVRRADTLFTPGPNVKPIVVQSSYCCSVVTVNNKNNVQAPTFNNSTYKFTCRRPYTAQRLECPQYM